MKSIRTIFILLIILLPSSGTSQIDSLLNIWLNKDENTENRFSAFRTIAGLEKNTAEEAINYTSKIHKLYTKTGREEFLSEYYLLKWVNVYNYPNLANDTLYSKLAFLHARNSKSDLHIAYSSLTLGADFIRRGDLAKAFYYLKIGLESCESKIELENPSEHLKSIISDIRHNLASLFQSIDKHELAIQYHLKNVVSAKKRNSVSGLIASSREIGESYLELDSFEQASTYLNLALDNAYELKTKSKEFFIASIYNKFGNLYYKRGLLQDSRNYFKKSLDIDSYYLPVKSASYNGLAEISNQEQKYLDAINFSNSALKILDQIPYMLEERNAYSNLFIANKALENNKKALMYLELLNTLEDSLNLTKVSDNLLNLEFEKQRITDSLNTQKDKIQTELNHQIELRAKDKTRNIYMGLGGFLGLLAIGLFGRNRYVKRAKENIEKEKQRSDNLLLNILPEEIAEELKQNGSAKARDYEMVSILFTDFKGFTEQSAKLSAAKLVEEINECFKAFDGICEKYDIEKIKTIGDAYMAVGGLPVATEDSVKNSVLAALEMQEFISNRKKEQDALGLHSFEMRAGIHTGPVVAGIVGVKKFQYDVWGDTVNTAARMESHGEAGELNISQTTYELVHGDTDFVFKSRGKIKAKGKGEIEMYFVSLNA